MTLKYGGGANAPPEVRARASRDGEWSVHAKRPSRRGSPPATLAKEAETKKKDAPKEAFPGSLPRVAPPCGGLVGSRRRDGKRIRPDAGGARALPAGARASACSAEVGSRRRVPVTRPSCCRRRAFPARSAWRSAGRGHRAVAVTLVKKPTRALVVRVATTRVSPRPALASEPNASHASPRSEGRFDADRPG